MRESATLNSEPLSVASFNSSIFSILFIKIVSETAEQNFWKSIFLATKSVSELISTIQAKFSSFATVISPFEADLSIFFEPY